MSQPDDPVVAVRRRILALKDEVMALGPNVGRP